MERIERVGITHFLRKRGSDICSAGISALLHTTVHTLFYPLGDAIVEA